ncbi:MAG: RIFT barrel domain-containing protein [Armatimonadota bacterium]
MRTPLHLTNQYYRQLPNVPFTYGVPIPEGAAKSVAEIALLDAQGRPAPVAVQAMATWPDGSVRWALLDFAGDFAPNEQADWELVIGEGITPPAPQYPVVVEETADGIRVSNGVLEATFRRQAFRLFDTLIADGKEIINASCRCDIVAVSPAGKIFRAGDDPAPKLSLEDVTPLRTVVRWDGGLFAGDGTRMTEFRLKLTFYAGNPYIKVEHSAVCREQPETGVMIREYRIDLETAQDRRTTKVVRQKNHGVDYFSRLVELPQNVHIIVPTTGADNQPAESAGFLGAVGKPVIEDEAAFAEDAAAFPHFLKPGAPRVALGGGYAVVYPFLGLHDERRTLVASILRMAPQHPKGLSADENRISIELWPAGHGNWRLSRGMTKTHHLALSVFGRALSAEEIDTEAVRREMFAGYVPGDPVTITLDPKYVRLTKQAEADKMLPRLPQRYPKLETKLEAIELHGRPLASSGMMDYGEAVATNNEEDQGHTYAMEYYRRGAWDQYQKLVAQMLHNSTVDVVDWDPDPLRMGGTPYHTHYHQDAVCVPSHTWTEGMFEYAYVTGDREAYRAAVGICEWILRFMDGKPQIVQVDGREIGWPIIALVAGYKATWDQRYLDGANRLVGYYRERVEQFGDLLNIEPPGTGYQLIGYGEYTGFEGMHKLWEVTGDEELRQFALTCIERAVERGHISFHGHGRMMDLYPIFAAYDMSHDPKWIELARDFIPIVLSRPDWSGYLYRRIIHFLGLCHDHGLLDDNQVVLAH